MKRLKKAIVIITVLALIFCLCACESADEKRIKSLQEASQAADGLAKKTHQDYESTKASIDQYYSAMEKLEKYK